MKRISFGDPCQSSRSAQTMTMLLPNNTQVVLNPHLMHAQISPHFFFFSPEEVIRKAWRAGVGVHKKYTMGPADMARRLSRQAYNW